MSQHECHDLDCFHTAPHACHMGNCRQDDTQSLRDENERLRSNLVNCVARLEAYYGPDYPAVRDAKAALTPQAGKAGVNG